MATWLGAGGSLLSRRTERKVEVTLLRGKCERVTNEYIGNQKIIGIASREASLRRKIRRHLRTLGFSKSDQGTLETAGNDKDIVRALHRSQRDERLVANATFLARRTPTLLQHFASGREVEPASITPVLERVFAETWQAELFRLASLTWSVPVSNGFGRRPQVSCMGRT